MQKLLAFLLATMLVITLLPVTAFAAVDVTLTVGEGGYPTIQEAINATGPDAGTYTIIVKGGRHGGTIQFTQRPNINIVIKGKDGATITGNMIIDGDARANGTDTVTIRDIYFDYEGTGTFIIDLKKLSTSTKNYSYTHNVTIENCTFNGNGRGFAICAGSSSGNTAYNTVVRNCEFYNLEGVLQARCQGLTLENVTATVVECGLNLYNSSNITLRNVKIHAGYYVLRFGENSGSANNGTVPIENCDLKSDSIDPQSSVIVIRPSSSVTMNITSSDIMGQVFNASSRSVSINANDVYWSKRTRFVGFNNNQLNFANDAASPHWFTNNEYEVKARAEIAYTVVITPSVDFGVIHRSMDKQSRPFQVSVVDALIEDGAMITVQNVSSEMLMRDKDGLGNETLAFELEQPDGYFEFTQEDLADGEETITTAVSCEPANLRAAGSYKGYMNFTVTYVPGE